ncbi:MAG: biosynthetic-type acetolactate synthase large subunit [Pseudomonadota bacterium]|nr:biosynthetic-type acetolactate synthase large subunit [Pseudomonadota bacterium]MEC8127914.1 biosynthetic-type acetolactate synthase large subunit [Pseudomonadota bacterium]
MMPGAEVLLKALEDEGVEVVFGYPGGAVLPIYDALFKNNKIRHILVRHEQAAVHAAEGYARSTGKTGVVLVTSGPGATNAVTGLTDALMDSVPVVCLTGQVPTHLIGNDAFQEADTTGITRPCTKHNYLVKDGERLQSTVIEAFHVAGSGRPGPVLIDLPKDILMKDASYRQDAIRAVATARYQPVTRPDPAAISQAVDMMIRAERPVIYGGGGLINSGPRASELLTELVEMTGWPTTLTLMGLGALSASNRHFLGMLGMHGTYEANLTMHGCDLMLNLGARFDDRVTGLLSGFSPNSQKIHCDIDPSSVNKNVAVDLAVIGDATMILEALLAELKKRKFTPHRTSLDKWWAQIESWRKRDCLRFSQTGDIIKPQHAIKRLCEMTAGSDVYVTTEVGQHQMWAAQYFDFHLPNRWMTSGGLGTMGYGLPAALGVQVAHPGATVIDIAGEASFMMNMQELSTLAQYNLPVKMFIINNEWMGMVRQWQELIHGGRYSESYSASLPDFRKLADTFGMTGVVAQDAGDLDAVITEMLETPGPVIADIRVAKEENCFPMIPSGAAHNDMLLGPEDQAEKPVSEEGMVLV